MSVRGLPQHRTEDKHLGRGVGVEPGVQACGPCESSSLAFSVLTGNIRKLEGMALSFLQALTGPLRLFSLLPFWNITLVNASPSLRPPGGETQLGGEAGLQRAERGHVCRWGRYREWAGALGKWHLRGLFWASSLLLGDING